MAQPSLCGHQQQQACNTIRGGTGSRTIGPSARNPRLVVETSLRPFCVDSEFGLVFYSYLSIGTLNLTLKRLSATLPGFVATLFADLCSFVAKDGSQCSGALLATLPRRPLLLRRKGRLSVLMICFRWVRANLCSFVAKYGSTQLMWSSTTTSL